MQELDQKEVERRAKLKAVKNFIISEKFTELKKEAEDRKDRAKATVVTAYLAPSEDGEIFTEVKKFNHKNKFAWGIESMSEVVEFIGDSEGSEVIKSKLKEGIDNSEEYIGCATVRIFPGSGGVVEYRYTDVEFTDSDRLIYKAQVWSDAVKTVELLEQEFSKEPEKEASEVSEQVEEVE